MQQYLELLKAIKERGTYKPAARENMPGTQSLFGYQLRHDLSTGFPLLTTKKMYWKGVVIELLWFLKGDTNIKYLLDNGVSIWNEDAYNYYCKIAKANLGADANHIYQGVSNKLNSRTPAVEEIDAYSMFTFDEFIDKIKSIDWQTLPEYKGYVLGDCGFQYGRVWRKWGNTLPSILKFDPQKVSPEAVAQFTKQWSDLMNSTSEKQQVVSIAENRGVEIEYITQRVDQIFNLINSLKNTPESRRHIVTAIDPAHEKDLALYWCHAMFQFNCRPLTYEQKLDLAVKMGFFEKPEITDLGEAGVRKSMKLANAADAIYLQEGFDKFCEHKNIPSYYLDCQLYQRSCDVVLGVPFNIASYALLTHILAKICNMAPGEYIHTFGDVHIYDNHKEAVEEQLSRIPGTLPQLEINCDFTNLDELLTKLNWTDCRLLGYNPQAAIKAELSTGLKK